MGPTMNYQILKWFALWLSSTVLKILPQIPKMFEYGYFWPAVWAHACFIKIGLLKTMYLLSVCLSADVS